MIGAKLSRCSSLVSVMVKAAIKASRGLLRDFSELEDLQVSVRNSKDFGKSADLKADKVLKEELLHARPSYSILSEESGETIGEDPSCRWVIDPLDGTINYMHGFPHWAISIALEKDLEIVAAVTYDPLRNEVFWAEKGYGAYLNNKKIRVAGRKSLVDSLVLSEISDDNVIPRTVSASAKIRKTGSFTLNMAYLASGRADILYSELNSNKWDITAGMLLIKEAGGVLADNEGKRTDDYKEIVVMTNLDLLPLSLKRQ